MFLMGHRFGLPGGQCGPAIAVGFAGLPMGCQWVFGGGWWLLVSGISFSFFVEMGLFVPWNFLLESRDGASHGRTLRRLQRACGLASDSHTPTVCTCEVVPTGVTIDSIGNRDEKSTITVVRGLRGYRRKPLLGMMRRWNTEQIGLAREPH